MPIQMDVSLIFLHSSLIHTFLSPFAPTIVIRLLHPENLPHDQSRRIRSIGTHKSRDNDITRSTKFDRLSIEIRCTVSSQCPSLLSPTFSKIVASLSTESSSLVNNPKSINGVVNISESRELLSLLAFDSRLVEGAMCPARHADFPRGLLARECRAACARSNAGGFSSRESERAARERV